MGSGETELKSLQCVLVAWPKLHGLCLCPHVGRGETVTHAESMLGKKIQIKHERLRFDLVLDDFGVSSKVKVPSIHQPHHHHHQ